MVTKWFKNFLASALEWMDTSTSADMNVCKVKITNGKTMYVYPTYQSGIWPTVDLQVSYNNNTNGVCVGSDTTQESDEDYKINAPIPNSIITVTIISQNMKIDKYGNPYKVIRLGITNKTNEEVTIGEIGYKSKMYGGITIEAPKTSVDMIVLFDRTVLEQPLVLQASETGIINYNLKTTINSPRIKAGLPLVSWESGSDEEIVALIEAAHQGIIDLQNDCGWKIGDARTINIGAWMGSSNHSAQAESAVISSFDDYNSCGCVMQFDIEDDNTQSGVQTERMNDTNDNSYNTSKMKSQYLPSLIDALPEWLKSSLVTFDVKVSSGGSSPSIVTVSNNKLALRAEIEVLGTNNWSLNGEGSLIPLYQIDEYRKAFGANAKIWFRSPVSSGDTSSYYTQRYVNININGTVDIANASTTGGIRPFGCL